MILGAGGYATVVQDPNDASKAIKRFKPNQLISVCRDEYNAHVNIHAMFSSFISQFPEFVSRIYVPEAYHFETCTNEEFICYYVMDKVTTHRSDRLAQHIVLNEELYEEFCGKIIFTDSNTKMISSDTILAEKEYVKGPRGAFLGKRQLPADLMSFAYCMGVLYQLVIHAGHKPKDVEFILDKTNRVCMIDFGMVNQTYTEIDKEIDMYLPPNEQDNTLYQSFNQGIQFVKENKNLYQ
jgi:hypothetical protein